MEEVFDYKGTKSELGGATNGNISNKYWIFYNNTNQSLKLPSIHFLTLYLKTFQPVRAVLSIDHRKPYARTNSALIETTEKKHDRTRPNNKDSSSNHFSVQKTTC